MRMIWSTHVGRMGELRNVYKIWIGKLEGKRQILGTICKRKLKRKLTAVIYDNVDRIYFAQNGIMWQALVNTVLKVWAPKNTTKFFTSFENFEDSLSSKEICLVICATHWQQTNKWCSAAYLLRDDDVDEREVSPSMACSSTANFNIYLRTVGFLPWRLPLFATDP
jgi:hypothetical protein